MSRLKIYMSSAEEKFVNDISGAGDRESLHRRIEEHRAAGTFSYNLRQKVQPRRPFDIGGDETDLSGNLLYQNHTLQDDDNTNAQDLLQEWDDIPVSPASSAGCISDDAYDDHDNDAEFDEDDEDDDDEGGDDCVSEDSGSDGIDDDDDADGESVVDGEMLLDS